MTHILCAVLFMLCHRPPRPTWQEGRPSCQDGYDVYAIERLAVAGRDSTVCVIVRIGKPREVKP